MAYNYTTKPANWLYFNTGTRNSIILDADLVSGNVRIPWDRWDGRIYDDFSVAAADINGQPTIEGAENWETGNSGSGTWAKTGGAAVWSGSGRGINTVDLRGRFSPPDVGNSGNRTFKITWTCTSGAPFMLIHNNDANPPSMGRVSLTVGGKVTVGGTAGPTTITAGQHTCRVVCYSGVASNGNCTVDVYLDGNLEISAKALTINGGDTGQHRKYGFGVDTGAVGCQFLDFEVEALNVLAASTWDCIDMASGDTVASGSLNDSVRYVDVPDPGYGPFHVRTRGIDRNDGSRGFREHYGDCYFGRLPDRAHRPTRPTTANQPVGDPEFDEVIHGWLDMGPVRRATAGSSADAATIMSSAKTWWSDFSDGVRPRRNIITFADGDADWTNGATLQAWVNASKAYGVAWDGFNEPGTIDLRYSMENPTEVQAFVTNQLIPFYNNVRTADATAVVISPSIVKLFEGGSFAWVANMAAAGAYSSCPALEHSFHAYNLQRINIGRCRRLLDLYFAALTAAGVQNRNVWQTEQGGLSEWDGLFQPMAACRDIALQIFMGELYGIIHERNVCWYDRSHGFDSFAAWQFGHYGADTSYGGNILPTPLMLCILDKELRGTVLDERFDFNDAADMYCGGRFTRASDSTAVVGLMAQSAHCPDVRLRVTGASSLVVVDAWGNTSTATVTGGIADIPCPDLLPVWVRVPAGVTVDVDSSDYEFGTDYCLSGTLTGSGGSFTNANRAINGTHYSIGEYFDIAGQEKSLLGNFPHYWTVDLAGGVNQINTVVVKLMGAIDAEIQTSPDGSAWTTRYHYQRTHDVERHVGNNRCLYARYEDTSDMLVWRQDDSISASHIRLKVNDATWNNTYIPAFDTEDQANECYNSDTSAWPMYYMTSVEKMSAFLAPVTEIIVTDPGAGDLLLENGSSIVLEDGTGNLVLEATTIVAPAAPAGAIVYDSFTVPRTLTPGGEPEYPYLHSPYGSGGVYLAVGGHGVRETHGFDGIGCEAGVSDCAVSATVHVGASPTVVGLLLRIDGGGIGPLLVLNTSSGLVHSSASSHPTLAPAANTTYNLLVRMNGTNVRSFINNTLVFDEEISTRVSATGHGWLLQQTDDWIDEFLVTSLAYQPEPTPNPTITTCTVQSPTVEVSYSLSATELRRQGVRGRWNSRKVNEPVGSLLKIGGIYRVIRTPTTAQMASATEVYQGGHSYHGVDGDIGEAIIAAGFSDWVTQE